MANRQVFAVVATVLMTSLAERVEGEGTEVSKLDLDCRNDGQLQIVDAFYYENPKHNYPCDVNCRPVSPLDPANRCFRDPVDKSCRPRLSLERLCNIYQALDTGDQHALKALSSLTQKEGNHMFRSLCLKDEATIDPCDQDQVDKMRDETFTSLMLRSSIWSTDVKSCVKMCRLHMKQPTEPVTVTSNFLTKSVTDKKTNQVSYRHIFTDCMRGSWVRLSSSYFRDNLDFKADVTTIRVDLNLYDLQSVVRLWLFFQGKRFSIWCTDTTEVGETTTNGAVSTGPDQEDSSVDQGNSGNLAWIVPLAVIIPALIITGVVCVLLRRKGCKVNCGASEAKAVDQTRLCSTSHNPAYDVCTLGSRQNDYTYVQTTGHHGNGAPRGLARDGDVSDVYNMLQRDQNANGQRLGEERAGGVDTYDHTLLQPGGKAKGQRGQQEEDYLELNRGHDRQAVVDNCYDSAAVHQGPSQGRR